jgi:hypothetical protein
MLMGGANNMSEAEKKAMMNNIQSIINKPIVIE